CDYPLQGDFLARAKNRTAPIPGVPPMLALWSYSMIHAGGVLLVTASHWCAAAELLIHAITDDAKCRGRISFATDQAIHVACKIAYVVALTLWTVLAEWGREGWAPPTSPGLPRRGTPSQAARRSATAPRTSTTI